MVYVGGTKETESMEAVSDADDIFLDVLRDPLEAEGSNAPAVVL